MLYIQFYFYKYLIFQINITRALSYYINNNEVNNLITYDIKNIKKNHKDYIKDKVDINDEVLEEN